MSRSQHAQWWHTAAFLGGGVLLASFLLLLGWLLLPLVVTVIAGALAWLAAPRKHRATTQHWDAQELLVRDGRPIVYWRPGCLACTRLRLRLGHVAQEATWVDIWADPEAAAFVRDVNDGAEITPTVILPDGEACTRPDPSMVRDRLEHLGKAA